MNIPNSFFTPFWFTRAVQKASVGVQIANAAPQRGSVAVRKAALALLGSSAALLTATTAHAHEGHGMPGLSHWHATDIWGFAVLGGIVALAIWMKGRK